MKKISSIVAAVGVATMLSSGAYAATMDMCADGSGSPNDPADGGDRYMTLEADSGLVECVGWGTGNFGEGNSDDEDLLAAYLLSEFDVELLQLIDKSDDNSSGSDPDALIGSLTSGLGGDFSIDTTPEYPYYLLVFKYGGGRGDPDWFAFLLDNEAASDDSLVWDTSSGFQNGLSHVDLYAAVPLPAAGLLLLGGLGGLSLLRRRKRV